MTSKNKPGSSRANTAGSRKDKHSSNKNGKKSDAPSGSSFFTWFMIIALLGVWSSVAIVWFDLVDYEDVLAKAKEFRYNLSEVLQGKLGVYDADGDGDFDVEDAKVLLGLKEVERLVPAEHFGKNEEPIQPSVHTTIETEEAIEGEEPPTEERRNEFEDDDSEDVEADESKMMEEEMMYEHAEPPEESEYVEDATLSEGAEIQEDSGPEVADVPEDKIPAESEVREEEVYDYAVSDEAELEPEEVVSEQHVPGLFESDVEEDLSDQMDSEDGMEEELPMSDEFMEENEVPKPEDTVEEFYAEDPDYVPETEDIQEVSPVLEKTDEDSQSAAVPLPEAVEELITEEEDGTLEGTEEHPAKEEEYVNYAEVSEPSEPDHLEVTGEPKEEADVAEPEEAIGATGLQEDTSDETVSLSEDKLKEMSSDL